MSDAELSTVQTQNVVSLCIQIIGLLEAIVLGIRAVCVLLVLVLFALMGLSLVLLTLLQ